MPSTGDAGFIGVTAPVDAGPPTDTCAIEGGSGLQLFGPAVTTESACQSQCDDQNAAHPNRTCWWGLDDLAPVGSCAIVGGAGASLFGPAATSEGQCFTECAALGQPHPNRTCSWTGPSGTVNLLTGMATMP